LRRVYNREDQKCALQFYRIYEKTLDIRFSVNDYLLVLDDVVSTGVACGAVASENLGTVLKIGGESCGGDRHNSDNNGSGDLR
jgi:hypothetical protein